VEVVQVSIVQHQEIQVVLVVVQKELKHQQELEFNQHKMHHLYQAHISVNTDILVVLEQLLAHIQLLEVVVPVVQLLLLVLVLEQVVQVVLDNHFLDLNILLLD
jgi:hypothetical protein